MTWLDRLVFSRSELEPPLSFWWWSGLAIISAVVKDNIWLHRQIYNLYPNIYVMFHADSGLKKGPPVAMAAKYVSTVNNTRVIAGRSSIQGILKDMSQAKTTPGGKIPTTDASVFICSSELSSSIVEDKVATSILTDLYDRQYRVGEWRSLLKMESFKLNNPTVTMLTATNEAHSNDFFAKKDIQGGYFARTFIIYEHTENRSNSLILPLKNPPNDEESINYLKALGKLKGSFLPLGMAEKCEGYEEFWTDPLSGESGYLSKAGLIYQQWYYDFKASMKNQFNKDETGTMNRFGDSVLKVAMLLSLAEKPELIITERAMDESIRKCEFLLGNVRQTTLGAKGTSLNTPLKVKIIMELLGRENQQISHQMLLKKIWMHYKDINEITELMASFEQAGMIRIEMNGNHIIYKMTENQVEEYKRFFAGKTK